MTRTITNESSKSIHDKPLAFSGDHILPHMKEVGPQVFETEVHRTEIASPSGASPIPISKPIKPAVHDENLLGHEDRKDVDAGLKDQLTESPSLAKPHDHDAKPEPEPAHVSKGKDAARNADVDEDDLAKILENPGHLKAPYMQRDVSSSSGFSSSLISVDAIAEALRYMRENSPTRLEGSSRDNGFVPPPAIVVSDESATVEGDHHKTRNIVEVITPDTEGNIATSTASMTR